MILIQKIVGITKKARKFSCRYIKDVDILSIEADDESDWVYGFDIDGNIIFDLNESYHLENIDLHIPIRLWKLGRLPVWNSEWPFVEFYFDKELVKLKSISASISVTHDGLGGVLIIISERKISACSFFRFSEGCAIVLDGKDLVGFLIRKFEFVKS